MNHLTTIDWICCIIDTFTIGAFLMRCWMIQRLNREVTAARRCGDILLTAHRQRHQRELDLLTRDYNDLRADRQRAILLCEQLAKTENQKLFRDIAQLTAENDTLRRCLDQMSWKVNAWGPKIEQGKA
jgi:hypothetical protein